MKASIASPDVAPDSFVHLDMARGLAALLVMLGHLRSFVFVSYYELERHNLLDTAVWVLTGFGHQCVMIFFVLSGFFIARSVVVDDRNKGFSWPIYMIKRLSRLWIVLLPCLLLTLFWDSLGILLTGLKFYNGELFSVYNSGPSIETGGTHLSVTTFSGNLLFLQTIVVPIFGSNGPLWSLSNEFWYYVIFPLLFLTFTRPIKLWLAVVNIIVLIWVAYFVGPYILLSGLIWLGGAVVYLIYDRGWFASVLKNWVALCTAFAILFGSLAFSKGHIGSDLAKDYLVGFGSCAVVLVLSRYGGGGKTYHRVAAILADGSYTMYLVHFSFLAFMINYFLHNQKFQASLTGYSIFIGLGLIAIAYCYAIYWLCERHTAKLRRYLLSTYLNARRSPVSG